MALTILHDVDEDDVAGAIKAGDLQLELILQVCFCSDDMLDKLIDRIEHLGGTLLAGKRTARFADAMRGIHGNSSHE